MSQFKAAVIGGGAFGTALAVVLARHGVNTHLWVRRQDQADEVNTSHTNSVYLPGTELPSNVIATTVVEEAVKDADIILFVIPTQFLRAFVTQHRAVWPVNIPLVLCAKGIEMGTLLTPLEILQDELPGKYGKWLAVLSGPSFAKEMVTSQPTNVTVAAEDEEVAKRVQSIVSDPYFRVYTSNDVMGCEVAGAVKNVLAIASGALGGLGFGKNTSAALICRGLAEMTRLAKKLGSDGQVMPGLAGIGDLLLTCTSELSRNFTVGKRLAKGDSLEEILSGKSVAEGVATSLSIHKLSAKVGVEMPICEEVYQVLYEGKDLKTSLLDLMSRPLKKEFED